MESLTESKGLESLRKFNIMTEKNFRMIKYVEGDFFFLRGNI